MVIYNRDIPDAPNNPSVDQPKMKENFNSIDTLLAVDHVSFNANNGGFHKQIDFAQKATPAAPVDPVSVAFTQNSASLTQVTGSATTTAQEFYRNALGIFPLSAIRAFGMFVTGGPGAIVPSNSFNVVSIVAATVGANTEWTVTLNANTTTTDNAAIFIYFDRGFVFPAPSYTFASNVLVIRAQSFGPFAKVSFLVLQV